MVDQIPADRTRRKRSGETPPAASPDPKSASDPREPAQIEPVVNPFAADPSKRPFETEEEAEARTRAEAEAESEAERNARRKAFLQLNQQPVKLRRNQFLGT